MYHSKSGKFLYHFFREKDDIFIQHYDRLLIRLDEEDIHNLRRAGKRIKALFQLFSEIDQEFNFAKRFYPVKDVFNAAGLYREIQVNFRTLNSYKSSSQFIHTYENFVSNKKQVFKNQLITAIEEFNPEKHNKSVKKIKKICQTIDLKDITDAAERFVRQNLMEIKALKNAEHSEERVHDIRIHLKRISPVINLLQVLKVPDFEHNIPEIKIAEDKLGYWHDRVVLLETLRQMKKLYPITKDLLLDFDWLVNQLTDEHISFIDRIEILIEPCIDRLDSMKFTTPVSDNL